MDIYIYTVKRITNKGEVNYIPLFSYFCGYFSLMAKDGLLLLQEDYKEEINMYKSLGYEIRILDIPFSSYIDLVSVERTLNSMSKKDLVKQEKICSLVGFLNIDSFSENEKEKIIKQKNYYKCMDENLNIVPCTTYIDKQYGGKK